MPLPTKKRPRRYLTMFKKIRRSFCASCFPRRIDRGLLREGTGRMKNIFAGIAVILLSILYSSVSTAEVGVTLRLDRGEATLADTLRMEVGVSDSRSSDAEPVLHGLEAFLVTKGGTSSRVEMARPSLPSQPRSSRPRRARSQHWPDECGNEAATVVRLLHLS